MGPTLPHIHLRVKVESELYSASYFYETCNSKDMLPKLCLGLKRNFKSWFFPQNPPLQTLVKSNLLSYKIVETKVLRNDLLHFCISCSLAETRPIGNLSFSQVRLSMIAQNTTVERVST